MEEQLGHDLGDVRVHDGAAAARSAAALDAVAFTTGRDVVFGAGAYRPETARGRLLLAHELAHVVQQRAGLGPPGGGLSTPGDHEERAADAAARRVAGGERGVLADVDASGATRAGATGLAIHRAGSFESLGAGVQDDAKTAEKITRPEQVLTSYGMTCYGTSVMYMIQSYGLVPPDMTREEFEYAFTPLNPKKPGDAKTDPIRVAGKEQAGALPIDLVTEALQGTPTPKKQKTSIGTVTFTEATLRGAERGSFTVADIMEHMPRILAAFDRQSAVKGYEFMRAHKPPSGTAYTPAKSERWIESAGALEKGAVGAEYFAGGNTVMTAVDYEWPPGPSLGHWVVIVGEGRKLEIAGRAHYLYPADDPLFGQVQVLAPMLRRASDKDLADAGLEKGFRVLRYGGTRVLMLFPGYAYARRASTTPRHP
jgi:hypothetical protein